MLKLSWSKIYHDSLNRRLNRPPLPGPPRTALRKLLLPKPRDLSHNLDAGSTDKLSRVTTDSSARVKQKPILESPC